MNRNSGGLRRIIAALGGYHVRLVAHRASDEDIAVLEHGGGISKDEINCAVDLAIAVELPEGMEE